MGDNKSFVSTCLTCGVQFTSHVDQREHFKTEWHRYNLKRKVVNMPTISQADFAKLEMKHSNQNAQEGPQLFYCCPCGKKVKDSQWDSHEKSKKHQLALKKAEESGKNTGRNVVPVKYEGSKMATDDNEDEWEDMSDDDEGWDLDGEGIPPDTCLFCDLKSDSMTVNLLHMSKVHSFFLPDVEYVVDVEELLTYLGKKIALGKLCLWCSEGYKSFGSVKAAQQHMNDKGHCKIHLETSDELVEFSDFYDYSASYEGQEESSELTVNPDMELVLPSGATLGHRSLKIYYKQNLTDKPTQVQNSKKKFSGHQLINQYTELGYRGSDALSLKTRARDIQFLRKNWVKQGVRNNKLQKHFRNQVDF